MKSKKLKCEICGVETNVRTKIKNPDSEFYGKKVCPFHAMVHSEKPKTKKVVKSIKVKRVKSNKIDGLGDFFQHHMSCILNNRKCCEECGKRLSGTVSEVAHILTKSRHPEVAKNDDNVMYLCFDCHSKFDSSVAQRRSMKCYPLAVERFNRIKELVNKKTNEFLSYGRFTN